MVYRVESREILRGQTGLGVLVCPCGISSAHLLPSRIHLISAIDDIKVLLVAIGDESDKPDAPGRQVAGRMMKQNSRNK